jgi:hypothetical protein
MAVNLRTYDSVGGFSVNNTTLVNDLKDVKNVNSLEVKNSFFSDASTTKYILRGTNTAILSSNDTGEQIILPSSTLSFITSHIVGVNASGGGSLSLKIESAVTTSSAGDVQVLSSMTTIINDTIPTGETWDAVTYDSGAANRFSYSTTRAGTTVEINWVASVEVVTVSW